MLQILDEVKCNVLPELLGKSDFQWSSLHIDYHPPTVDRLWCQWGEFRISLHKIYPCDAGSALFHPHASPSAMQIYSGAYEMGIGYGVGDKAPPVAVKVVMAAGSKYEMLDRDSWHYVRPIDGPVMTLMVTGKPWGRNSPKSSKKLGPLNGDQEKDILNFFRMSL